MKARNLFVRSINALCLPLVLFVPLYDMYNWKTWNYVLCLKFEINVWLHNVTGNHNISVF